MDEIAVGTVVFQRAEKIRDLLDSIDEHSLIETVYVGDNGEITDRKREIYDREYPFELNVLDLKYDSGLGHSRREIVEESNEPYLLIVDSDVEIPHNVGQLQTILQHRPDLGGVGGVLIESDRIRSDCYDLFKRGPVLLKDIQSPKQVQKVSGLPLVEFDQIQNVAMFRRECLEDYCWDSEYTIGWEHTDFFVGHKRRTDWSFGVCPEIMFRHYPGGDESYRAKRRSWTRIHESKQYFLDKWDFEQVMNGETNWLRSNSGVQSSQEAIETVGKRILLSLPPKIQASAMNMRDRIRYYRGQPPA
ncbi:glycosyltransferase family 2 protein [Halorubrum sp. CSM-61]|uniref:glycosyltransferase family 2 protein n=1 Tax=Halorubrum sp. CSM-61 TaxID=2485838 RepID=UPI000F4BA859|nr:glycosyltransferase family 2 protein [Halorubrum sp. CSM-61]